ncbi:MAG TPA: CDP-alcohol phosphatidyltransferase family protein [Labilithrix sp.]|jgi:phosphatidylglycerophosphate synthase|nr:CDP-alcohol phosphatidyltransferase family protein [Labilithrix sp.]
MFGTALEIYRATRKKHDLVFNVYVMRPIAAFVVGLFAKTPITPNQVTLLNLFIFVLATILLVAMPDYRGGLLAIFVLELSYCLDCVDGMLARFKKIASKEGHLFDFFTDEIKAVLLASALPIRFWRSGALGFDGKEWPAGTSTFLFAGIAGAIVLASGTSLTNFLRRPEVSGRESTVEAHYETVVEAKPKSLVGRLAGLVTTFLRFLNHYPSHIWIFALLGRLDVMFWIYVGINFLNLGRGWLGIILRFGRPHRAT